ncbi:zf-DHHC-domain-containing protein, partial [Aureobasidium melanogenum]
MYAIQIGAGILPPVTVGIVSYVTYVVVVVLCIDVWISPPPNQPQKLGYAAVVLIFFLWFLISMAVSFGSTIYHAYLDPGILSTADTHDPEQQTTAPFEWIYGLFRKVHVAPTLDSFHEQAFFECDESGKPLWCDYCKHWKPNRAHHSKMLNRCILKFDHYCPWVGGYITATNLKTFLLFSISAAMFSLVTLISVSVPWNHGAFDGHDVTGHLGVTVGFAVFFLCIAGGSGLSAVLLASADLTTLDNAAGKRKVWTLAVRIDEGIAAEKAITAAFSGVLTFATSTHTFAIVETFPGANPYDVGLMQNWRHVMGASWWHWVLPLNLQGDDRQSKMAEITPAVAAALEESGLGAMDTATRGEWQKMQVRQKGFLQLLAAAGAPLKTFATWKQARKE